jgi:hypothetical protein
MASLTKPSETFHSRILPAQRDCIANPLDQRYADIAAGAVVDQIEWVFHYYDLSDAARLEGSTNVSEFRRLPIYKVP